MVIHMVRESTLKRQESLVNTVPVTVPPPEKSSEKWKSLSMLNTDAPSAARMRKLY